ncbi:MAG TPA: hypothetical protein VGD78_02670 [Chthoniobacterales bacterium]
MHTFRFLASLPLCFAIASAAHADEGGNAAFRKVCAAHGSASLVRFKAVGVGYTGRWGLFLNQLQPVLCDVRFRRDSDETYWLGSPHERLRYRGAGGEKLVEREPGKVRVIYNGNPEVTAEQAAAAALVADAYRMFLLGPQFFQERRAEFTVGSPRTLGGQPCTILNTTLRPGFGRSPADTVALWIDPTSHLIRRYGFTINGLSTTVGAYVDVTAERYVDRGGVRFATQFSEWVRQPLQIAAHKWHVVALEEVTADDARF